MATTPEKDPTVKPEEQRSRFPPLFWLVVIFEFFERGSYYGMMSVLSVYMTDVLHFAKQDVGVVKATIQPLLYFLPIISGALADRFGYRRTLMVAFSLLGGGYFLTSQATEYATVFLSLVVMGIGAGTFKPVISGTIARCTDETNSTLGFGIFYWTINLGAFLFPLILVPYLKNNIGWDWVIIASAIGTGAMLLPTLLLFREPPRPPADEQQEKTNLLETVANAFEIIYSPIVLLASLVRRTVVGKVLLAGLALGLLGGGVAHYLQPGESSRTISTRRARVGQATLIIKVERNLCKEHPFAIKKPKKDKAATREVRVVVYKPDERGRFERQLLAELRKRPALRRLELVALRRLIAAAQQKTTLDVIFDRRHSRPFTLERMADNRYRLTVAGRDAYEQHRMAIGTALRANPRLAALDADDLAELADKAQSRTFFVLFLGLLLCAALVIIRVRPSLPGRSLGGKIGLVLATLGVVQAVIWLLPELSLFTRILTGIIALTLLSLFEIKTDDHARFNDHFRFLLMVFIYSGFWVLYFQMFDSVLWYVQAYVDASGVNSAVNALLGALRIDVTFRFDVEHVTVVNAGTIIALQLLISSLVKKTRALPTMIVGIALGTVGMAILAVSTGIWVFLAGIIIFSVGEMTAHPKFISYVGQTAPKSRVAMYMGYLFLYGVIGASIGSMVGANLYVKVVDEMNRPRTLWLIFAAIGLLTILALLLYNRLLAPRPTEPETGDQGTNS